MCPECGKKFAGKNNRNGHMKVHKSTPKKKDEKIAKKVEEWWFLLTQILMQNLLNKLLKCCFLYHGILANNLQYITHNISNNHGF